VKTPSERNELVGFIHRHDLAPTISQRGIAKAFDNRVRELEENYNPNVIIEALRHGENDKVVPITLGERLYGLLRSPKCFVRIAGGGHNDLGVRAIRAAKHFIAEQSAA